MDQPPRAAEILLRRGILVIPDIYLHRRSHRLVFEWLKTLSHVRFGWTGKQFEATSFEKLLQVIEEILVGDSRRAQERVPRVRVLTVSIQRENTPRTVAR
jgi:hypothetical protein